MFCSTVVHFMHFSFNTVDPAVNCYAAILLFGHLLHYLFCNRFVLRSVGIIIISMSTFNMAFATLVALYTIKVVVGLSAV